MIHLLLVIIFGDFVHKILRRASVICVNLFQAVNYYHLLSLIVVCKERAGSIHRDLTPGDEKTLEDLHSHTHFSVYGLQTGTTKSQR